MYPLLAYTHWDTNEAFGVQSVSTFLKPLHLLIYTAVAWLDLGKEIYRVVSSTLGNRWIHASGLKNTLLNNSFSV